jgi:hypothetical protein
MPEITYEDRDWATWRTLSKEAQADAMKNNAIPTITKTRRVSSDELEIIMFPQTWGSTALGYGGIGGAAMTGAYTIIISFCSTTYCVYFGGGQLAYRLNWADMTPSGRDNFFNDVAARTMVEVRGSGKYR